MTVLTFQPSRVDFDGEDPSDRFSRTAWLPIVGPSSWLLWGSIVELLRSEKALLPDGRRMVTWDSNAMARAHGLKTSDAIHAPVRKSLARLCRFDLLQPANAYAPTNDHWLVRCSAPPLSPNQLDRSTAVVAALQRITFGEPVAS